MDLKIIATIAILVVISTLVSFTPVAESRPSYSDSWSLYHNRLDTQRRSQNECVNSEEVLEVCQRCAKLIKSRHVYPMCCERKENTREWCVKFLAFGGSSG